MTNIKVQWSPKIVYFHISSSTEEMIKFLFFVLMLQIVTSGFCICGSIYSLKYVSEINFFRASNNTSDINEQIKDADLVEYAMHLGGLLYNIFDIFMVMHLGNEIMLSSDKLSYRLFESNWVDQPQSIKKCVIIFGERLKQPHFLVIGVLYSLTLETFVKVS